MGGLSLALNNALSGLNVNQQALSVLSQNIANANTPGYSKQIINQKAISLVGEGQGVTVSSITRKVDEYLAKAMRGQNSIAGAAEVMSDYNGRIQLLLGQPGSQNSIDSFLNTFYTAIQSLAQTPQNTTLQQSAVNAATSLTSAVQLLANNLRDVQFQADKDITLGIQSINADLRELQSLNVTIVNNKTLGKGTADLEDQRDAVINSIAKYINVNSFTKEDGSVFLTTGAGVSIADENLYQLNYSPLGSPLSLTDGTELAPITVTRLNRDGTVGGLPITLVTGGTPTTVKSSFTSGQIAAFLELRGSALPNIMSQLDTLVSMTRDQFNAVHNLGSGYPGANSFTGTRLLGADDYSQWAGSVRIAVLDANGAPVTSPYDDEPNGFMPLTLDLSKLNSSISVGTPTLQDIIDAINAYYGTPQNKVEVGNMNNIQLVSNSRSIPLAPPAFNFDFDLNNISSGPANFYVTGVQVLDNTGADITSVTNNVPSLALNGTNTYTTLINSEEVLVSLAAPSTLQDGDVVYLSTPGVGVGGLSASQLGGYFKVSNVTATGFTIHASSLATSTASANVASQTALPPYQEAEAGQNTRTLSNGQFSANLAGNPTAPFYTFNVTVGVDDGTGNVKETIISYRVNNQIPEALNLHVSALATSGAGTLVPPNNNTPLMKAIMVDEQGIELPKINGKYITTEPGFLKLVAGNSENFISIDSLDSVELGRPNNSPPGPATNRGFSYYFELNNFFESNQPTTSGDTVYGSALNFAVESRINERAALVTLGKLSRSSQPIDPSLPPDWTYERNASDNSIVQKLSVLATTVFSFAASGGLGVTSQTFSGYAAQIIGVAATNARNAETSDTNAQNLLTGYGERSSALSGVNLDTELANTVIYQNAYAASARVITVANTLFQNLLDAFGT